MLRKSVLAVVAVSVAWAALDLVLHGVLLQPAYAATAPLWRPLGEMKTGVLYASVLLAAVAFVGLYARLFARRGVRTGLEYGLWLGLGGGVSMGYGTYAVMPIPYHMALAWFLGTLVEAVVAGLLVGWILPKNG